MDLSHFLAVVLGLWLMLTLLNAHSYTSSVLSKHLGEIALLVPKWNFFSPHPGEYDYYVLYRGRRSDQSTTAWRRIDALDYRPRTFRWLWNPDVFQYKSVFDATQRLTQAVSNTAFDEDSVRDDSELRDISLDGIEFTTAYLTFLNCVSRQDHSPLVNEIQFAIVRRSRRSESNEPVFTSGFHTVEHE